MVDIPRQTPERVRHIIPEAIDLYMPYQGPCAFCGFPDKRHRVLDSIVGRYRAGDSAKSIGPDFNLTEEAIAVIVDVYDADACDDYAPTIDDIDIFHEIWRLIEKKATAK